jgi:hypothetical protein
MVQSVRDLIDATVAYEQAEMAHQHAILTHREQITREDKDA